MSTVAEQLRSAREEQKLNIYQVAEITKIKTDHIRALEAGQYDTFSAPVYIRGFVRTYAKALKLDVTKVSATLDSELARTEKFSEPPPLGAYLNERFSNLSYYELGADPSDAQLEAIRQTAQAAEQLLAAFVVKPAAWHRFGLPPKLRDWLQQLASSQPTVAACLGAPQGLDPLAAAATHICTFSDVPVSQRALVEKLLSTPVA